MWRGVSGWATGKGGAAGGLAGRYLGGTGFAECPLQLYHLPPPTPTPNLLQNAGFTEEHSFIAPSPIPPPPHPTPTPPHTTPHNLLQKAGFTKEHSFLTPPRPEDDVPLHLLAVADLGQFNEDGTRSWIYVRKGGWGPKCIKWDNPQLGHRGLGWVQGLGLGDGAVPAAGLPRFSLLLQCPPTPPPPQPHLAHADLRGERCDLQLPGPD